jgi:hypothetical protein
VNALYLEEDIQSGLSAPHNVTSGCSNCSRSIRIQPHYGGTSASLSRHRSATQQTYFDPFGDCPTGARTVATEETSMFIGKIRFLAASIGLLMTTGVAMGQSQPEPPDAAVVDQGTAAV